MSVNRCRAFEGALEKALSTERVESLDALLFDAHVGACSDCRGLLFAVRLNAAILAHVSPARVDASFVGRLSAPPSDFAERRAASEILDLLRPGTLTAPAPSPELLSQLAFLPTRANAQNGQEARPRGILSWLFGDWRVTIAATYAVTMVLLFVLGLDPLSAARETASDLTSAGERAVTEARSLAAERLAKSGLSPLRDRFDYRAYRALAATRARAAAYGQLVLEKVFGGVEVVTESSTPPQKRPAHESDLSSPKRSNDGRLANRRATRAPNQVPNRAPSQMPNRMAASYVLDDEDAGTKG